MSQQPLTTAAILRILETIRSAIDALIEHYRGEVENEGYEDRC